MLVTLFGIVTDVRPPQLSNAKSPMLVTFKLSIEEGIITSPETSRPPVSLQVPSLLSDILYVIPSVVNADQIQAKSTINFFICRTPFNFSIVASSFTHSVSICE